jgi:2-methylcitrate dehydratase PrpD
MAVQNPASANPASNNPASANPASVFPFGSPATESDLAEHGDALAALGAWAAHFTLADLSPAAREALDDLLANFLAVTAGAANNVDQRALVSSWDPEPGACSIIGTDRTAPLEAAIWLNGAASVSTERDSGNRFTRGHPAAQTFPAVIALAERLDSSGEDLLRALAVAHEIAARFGRATTFDPTVHTHGTFGVPGAAAGCAILLGLDAGGITRAIDAGCALPPATNWGPVLRGSAIRDQWIGAGNLAGLAAARYAAAGHVEAIAGTLPAFGGTLGTVTTGILLDGLGTLTLLEHGYLKTHSSCAYTHAPIDASLLAREQIQATGVDVSAIAARIDSVSVLTTAAGAALDNAAWTTRHGAFFSVPFAVASALTFGDVGYERSSPDNASVLAPLAARITVTAGAEDIAAGPTHRPAQVTVHLTDGSVISTAVTHPRGDSDLSPYSRDEVAAILADALADNPTVTVGRVTGLVATLPSATSTSHSLRQLLSAQTVPPQKENHNVD